jgi:FSR family fosmidomycin resistance protein-like MFS transporter
MSIPAVEERDEFQTGEVLPVVGAHFVNDIYTAAIAPLLPVFIEKFTLSLTQAGMLTAISQLPAIINPLIGYVADKKSIRYFVIFAPAVTATMISMLGFAPNYFVMLLLLFASGISVAAFHAPAPALVGRLSGKKVGLGMSLFMAGGEMAFTVGPLLAVWAVSIWTLEGFWRTVFLGWAATVVLYWRLHNVAPRIEKAGSLRSIAPSMLRLFLPLSIFALFRFPMLESISTYLPTYMKTTGTTLVLAGVMFSVVQFAGVAGVLMSGPLSDRLGRKWVLAGATLGSAILMLLFIHTSGWTVILLLLGMGFLALSTTPVMLAMVQEQFPKNRAVANGIFMSIVFVLRPLGTLAIGTLGDRYGLQTAFLWGALISFLSLPVVLLIPTQPSGLDG